MIITQVTLHPELVDWRCVVHANFRLLSIVSDTHTNMVLTSFTPDIVWHFKSVSQFNENNTDIN